MAFSGDLEIRAVGAAVPYDLLARDFCVLVARVENITSNSTGEGKASTKGMHSLIREVSPRVAIVGSVA